MIKPLFNNVLLQEVEAKTETESGIILGASTEEEPILAKVVAIGDGLEKENTVNMDVIKVGDTVMYKKYSTNKITYNGEDYLLIPIEDIMAIVEVE